MVSVAKCVKILLSLRYKPAGFWGSRATP